MKLSKILSEIKILNTPLNVKYLGEEGGYKKYQPLGENEVPLDDEGVFIEEMNVINFGYPSQDFIEYIFKMKIPFTQAENDDCLISMGVINIVE